MATTIPYSASPFGTGDIKTGSPTLTISSGVATFSAAQTGNIGVGDRVTYDTSKVAFISVMTNSTTATLITATGGTPGDEGSAVTVNSIAHEYASISAFEAGFTDANHINNANLVTADVLAQCACYYDHDDQTADTTRVIVDWTGTTDATRFLGIFTPGGGTESINDQRHDGKRNTNRFELVISTDFFEALDIKEAFTEIDGLQLDDSAVTNAGDGILHISNANGGTSCTITNNIIKGGGTTKSVGVRIQEEGCTIYNNIIYDVQHGIQVDDDDGNTIVYSNTVQNTAFGIIDFFSNGTMDVSNNISIDSVSGDFSDSGAFGTTAGNISSDTSSPQVPLRSITMVFADKANDDFHLDSSDTDAIGGGADLDPPVSVDIDGDTRDATAPDIGADEFVAVGGNAPTGHIQGPLFGSLGGPI